MTASENDEDSINYFQWQYMMEERLIRGEKTTVKIVTKVLFTSPIEELKSKLIEELPAMKKHVYGIEYHNKVNDNIKKNKEKLTYNANRFLRKLC